MVGPAAQRDAFVFGLPGRYTIVLPTALVVRHRQAAMFDPVVRHELAHIGRRDVPFAWLATGVWVAAIPVLVAPLVVAAARRDFSLMPEYLWRAAVVMAVLWLVQRQALRSREHDADLHAARQAGDWRPLCSVLELNRSTPGWWRRFLSHHPTIAQRLDILTDPGRVRGVSFVDALAAGFLTALLLPLIHSVLLVTVTGTDLVAWTPHISAALVGPITGLAVGVGLWRQALIDRVTGATTWPGGAVFGVVAGLLIGHFLGLDDLGLDDSAGVPVPVIIFMGAAGVLLSAGTGRLWADAAARLPGGPRSWWIGFIVNALIFAVVLWALQWVPVYYEAITLIGYGPLDLVVVIGPLATEHVLRRGHPTRRGHRDDGVAPESAIDSTVARGRTRGAAVRLGPRPRPRLGRARGRHTGRDRRCPRVHLPAHRRHRDDRRGSASPATRSGSSWGPWWRWSSRSSPSWPCRARGRPWAW